MGIVIPRISHHISTTNSNPSPRERTHTQNSDSEAEREKMRSKEATQFSPRNSGHLSSSQGEGAMREGDLQMRAVVIRKLYVP